MSKLAPTILLMVMGCSGPIAMQRAIWPQHEREFAQRRDLALPTPREAWYVWQAERRGESIEAVRAADMALSTTRNPFDARRDGAAVSRGAILFREQCARCHGMDVGGNGPEMLAEHPTKDFHAFDKRFAATLHGGAPRTWFQKISNGYGDEVEYPDGRGPAMPAFGQTLAREQIWLVITYLQSLDMYAQSPPAEAD